MSAHTPMLFGLVALALAASPTNWYVFQMQRCSGADTIHGLWPQWAEWCDGPPFDPGTLAPIAAELAEHWPSCAGDDNATAFHAHEWAKHGTCTGLSELQYFDAALTLRSTYANVTALTVCVDLHFRRIPCA